MRKSLTPLTIGTLALAVALLVLALLLPRAILPLTPPSGDMVFRISLASTAMVMLIGAAGRRWFNVPGLPTQVTGLLLGPKGWENERTLSRRWLVGGIMIVATILRLINLNNDLWLDEIATMTQFARWPLIDTLTRFTGANQHVFFAALSNLSVSLFGESHWALRLPAVVFGVLSIPALYYFAKPLTSRREILWTMALMAVSYHHIWFSQSARGWIGLLFFSLLGGGLFIRGLAQNKTGSWLAYAAVMALGIFTHLNTVFVFLGHIFSYIIVLTRWPEWKRDHWPITLRLIWVALLTGTLTILAHSYLLADIFSSFTNEYVTGIGWTNPIELLVQILRGLVRGWFGLGVLILGSIALVGMISYWKQSRLIIGFLIFPGIFNVLVLIFLGVGGYPRTFIYVLPLALLLAVRGAFRSIDWVGERLAADRLGEMIRHHGSAALLGTLVVASLVSLIPYYQTPKQDYTGALQFVESQRAPHDVVAAVGLASTSYRAYYAPDLAFPETEQGLASLRGDDHVTWVIYTFQRDMRLHHSNMYDYIEDEFTLIASFPGTVGDGTIWVARADGAD